MLHLFVADSEIRKKTQSSTVSRNFVDSHAEV